MKTIIFDREALCWVGDVTRNEHFLKMQTMYLNERFACRGYMYLSDIYDTYGMRWDPHNENIVWIRGEDEFISTYELTGDNTFTIKVGY